MIYFLEWEHHNFHQKRLGAHHRRFHNVVYSIKNYDSFYQKAEPRQLSDWESPKNQLNPINSVIGFLMSAAKIDRVDQLFIPGILHFKLSYGSLLNLCKISNFFKEIMPIFVIIFQPWTKLSFNRMLNNANDAKNGSSIMNSSMHKIVSL